MDAALAHHQRTAHRPDRLAGARGPLDWTNRPRGDKHYRDVPARALPTDFPVASAAAGRVVSGGPAGQEPAGVDLTGLARLLFLAGGVVRRRRLDGMTIHFRSAPSAGALYPVEAYVVCADLDGLPAGVYHFEPVTFTLQALRAGDWRSWLADAAGDAELTTAPVTVALTGVPWRTAWKYGERGYRHLYWDAGAVAANLLEAAAAVRLPVRLLVGFVDQAVADLLGVSPGQAPAQGGEVPLALAPLGGGAGAARVEGDGAPSAEDGPAGAGTATTSGEPPALRADVEPLSSRVVDEPGLWETQRAGDLETARDVAAWRQRVASAATSPAPHAVPAPAPPVGGDPFDDVVLLRGSTRRFAREPVPRHALEWPLAVAGRHVAGDLAAPGATHLRRFVAVHAVEGVDAGAYRVVADPDEAGSVALARIRDVARSDTAGLCLGQPLGGDAAYTVFLAADIDALVGAAGDRAYRVAQIEAGVAAERLQLAAFAAGVGATGLTFFDEEVRRFFATPAWPMLVVAVGRPAYEVRPGRRPG